MSIAKQNQRRIRDYEKDHTFFEKPTRCYQMRGPINPNDPRRFQVAPNKRKSRDKNER